MARKPLTRILVTVLAVGAVAGASCALLTLRSPSRPLPPIPTPVMPKPNAYDIYHEAYQLSGGWGEVDVVNDSFRTDLAPSEPRIPASVAYKHAAADLPAVAKIREGFRYQYLAPPIRSLATFGRGFGSEQTGLAALLCFEGRVCTARGEWDEALGYDIDACRYGSDLPHGGGVEGAIHGYGCQSMGRHEARATFDHVSAVAAKENARRLFTIAACELPTSEVFETEEWQGQAVIADSLRNPNWRQSADADTWASTKVGFWREAISKIRAEFLTPQKVERDYYEFMAAQIRDAKLPWTIYATLRSPRPPGDPISASFAEIVNRAMRFHREKCVALDELFATELALRAYELEHAGTYPPTLAGLTPVYLPDVPVDPFSDGHPMQYRLTKSGYLLYSVGPDCKDDGGTPMVNARATTPAARYSVTDDAEGDIVAGVNY